METARFLAEDTTMLSPPLVELDCAVKRLSIVGGDHYPGLANDR